MCNLQLALGDHITGVMEFHPDVFDLGVEDVVFSEVGCSIVVAVKGCGVGFVEAQAIKQLTEEGGLVRGIM
jgi:hypothetical protein